MIDKRHCHWCTPSGVHDDGPPVICSECLAKVSPPPQPPPLKPIEPPKRRRKKRAA